MTCCADRPTCRETSTAARFVCAAGATRRRRRRRPAAPGSSFNDLCYLPVRPTPATCTSVNVAFSAACAAARCADGCRHLLSFARLYHLFENGVIFYDIDVDMYIF